MQFPQHFIIEGRHLGTSMRGYVFTHSEPHIPSSYAFFCPVCAELWARCPVEVKGGSTKFQVISKGCKKHSQHAYEVGGSLWLAWDKTFNDAFPDGLMKWELDRHLALYDNESKA